MQSGWLSKVFFLLCLFGWLPLSSALEIPLEDGAQEARARALFNELRCVVCEGQALSDSNADIAVTMRALVRNRIKDGSSDDEIKDFLVERYGREILQQPPISTDTGMLWGMPAALVMAALAFLFFYFRQPSPPAR